MITLGPIEKLGTTWWFEFFDLDEEQTEYVKIRLSEYMDTYENNYSRFIDESIVCQLNDTGVVTDPSAEFLGMLQIATDAYRETNGVFNIAVGDHLEKSGYDRTHSFHSVETPDSIPKLDDVLSVSEGEVRLDINARIDFGGFGKGYLIDLLVVFIQNELGLQEFLINGGGDIYATSQNGEPISIGLQDPQDRKKSVGSLQLHNQGFAASSPYVRVWTDQDGVEHNHLVGSEQLNAVFVTAPTATVADIWATTLAITSKTKPPSDVQFNIA